MLRTVGSVVGSYIVIGVLVVLTDLVLARIGVLPPRPPIPTRYFAITLALDTLYSVIGGFLCARLATEVGKAILALILFGEFMGVVATVLFWHVQPHWWAAAILITYPAAILLGGRLAHRKRRAISARY